MVFLSIIPNFLQKEYHFFKIPKTLTVYMIFLFSKDQYSILAYLFLKVQDP